MLLQDFSEDQVVYEGMSMLKQIRLTLLNGQRFIIVNIQQNKPLFDVDVILIYDGRKHYSTVCKSLQLLLKHHQFSFTSCTGSE